MNTRFHWSRGNAKLRRTQAALRERGEHATLVAFGLPAFASTTGQRVCPGAGSCRKYCYARQGRYVMPASQGVRERNLTAVRQAGDALVEHLVEDLDRMRSVTHVRLHDSGDFFSAGYLAAWAQVAQARPDVVFYGYTKSIPLLHAQDVPANLRLVQSLGGVWDGRVDMSQPHSRVFADVAALSAAGYADGSHSDVLAIDQVRRIGLVYHGTRRLNAGDLGPSDASSNSEVRA